MGFMKQKIAEYRLGNAIAKHDYASVKQCLEWGARHIDYMLMRPNHDNFGPKELPAGKYTDPLRLAHQVGFKDAVGLMQQQYGMSSPEVPQIAPAQPKLK